MGRSLDDIYIWSSHDYFAGIWGVGLSVTRFPFGVEIRSPCLIFLLYCAALLMNATMCMYVGLNNVNYT